MPVVVVPVIGVILIALLALLLIYAGAYLVQTLANLVPDWNIIGFSSIRKFVLDQALFVQQVLNHWYHLAIGPAMNIIAWPIIAFETAIQRAWEAINSANVALRFLKSTVIPQALQQAIAFSNYVYLAATTVSLDEYNRAIQNTADIGAYILTQVGNTASALRGEFTNLVNDARAYTLSLYNSALANISATGAYILTTVGTLIYATKQELLGDISRVETLTNNLYGVAESDIRAALSVAEAYALTASQHAVGVLVTDIDQSITATETAVWPDITAGIKGVEDVLGDDLADIMNGIRAIPRAIPGDIAGAFALTTAISIPMLKYMEKCGIPNCRNLSALGRDLQALLGLVGDAAFLEFILSLVHHPTNAANEVQDVLGDAFNGMLSTARELLSL